MCGHIPASFPGVDETELVIGVEVVIDPRVELVPVGVQSIGAGEVIAIDPPREANAGRVQAVANRVIVGLRHSRQQRVLDEARRIVSQPEWIAGEHAELLKITCHACGSHWIALAIDGRVELSHVLVIDSRKISKDALPRQRRQYCPDEGLAEDVSLFVHQDEKEGLVLDDRPS